MRLGSRSCLGFALLSLFAGGCKEPLRKDQSALVSAEQQVETPQVQAAKPLPIPPTPADFFGMLERELSEGRPEGALSLAKQLINSYGTTAEAEKARLKLPEIEAAVNAKAEAERVRRAEEAAAAEARRLANKWTYKNEEDPMSSRKTRIAAIESENTVSFGFPYEGAQRGTLFLRDHPSYGRDVILTIEQGQLLCHSYEDCRIRVRFDENTAEIWRAVGPADNSSTSLFLRSQPAFVKKMRNAKVVRVQIPVYQQGEPIFEFHVGGFDYTRYSSAK